MRHPTAVSPHTPGPWTVVTDGAMTRVVGPDVGERIATILRTRDPSNDSRWTPEAVAANARLIAAAPTLYGFAERRAAEGDEEAATILRTIHANP